MYICFLSLSPGAGLYFILACTFQWGKKKLKIAKPWKTSQEITWIYLEVYNLDFDMTTINQFSQLCSRLAHEKGIILLDTFLG